MRIGSILAVLGTVAALTLAAAGAAVAEPKPTCAQAEDILGAAQFEFDRAVEAARKRAQQLGISQSDVAEVEAKLKGGVSTTEQVELIALGVRLGIGVGDLPLAERVKNAANALAEAIKTRDEVCTPTTTAPPTTAPPADDIDCDEVSDARAQEILDADKTDPHDLDADGDGIACEEVTPVVDNDDDDFPSTAPETGGE